MGERSRGIRHLTALLIAGALAVTACGARLTDEQRAAGIGALGGGEGGGASFVDPSDPGSGTGSGTGTDSNGSGVTGPGVTGPSIAPSAPPGGNGGATDVGVTATELTIATVSDTTGIQPGLFKSTHDAIQALAAMVNSEGGIDGRLLNPVLIDSKTSSDGNLSGVLQACDKAFALVGSMSAFDDGGAREIDRCGDGDGIPDISAITVNPDRIFAKNSFPAYPVRPDLVLVGTANYIRQQYPGVETNAAMLFLNAGVTRINALQRVKAYEKVGWDFIYTQAVQLAETNYNSYVQALKNHDPPIKYVSMVADYQSINRLLKAMRQQQWQPEVLDFDSVVYSPQFHRDAQGAAEGILFFLNTGMLEESASTPEIQLYQQWLARVAPGSAADYFGMYAWSAGRLFVDAAKKAGPRLTREKLLAELKKITSWTGNGLHAAHNIGANQAAPCYLYATVRGDAFVRVSPASPTAGTNGQTCSANGNQKVTL